VMLWAWARDTEWRARLDDLWHDSNKP